MSLVAEGATCVGNAGSQLRPESIYLHDTAGLRNGLGVVKCLYQEIITLTIDRNRHHCILDFSPIRPREGIRIAKILNLSLSHETDVLPPQVVRHNVDHVGTGSAFLRCRAWRYPKTAC
jgi:hypothetical protein